MYIQDIRTNFKWVRVKSKLMIEWLNIAYEKNQINFIHKTNDEYEISYNKGIVWCKGVSFDLWKTIMKCNDFYIVCII